MTLYKTINGERIALTEQEEANTRIFWLLNEKYPLYTGAIAFDGLNEPYVLIEQARKNHLEILTAVCNSEIAELTKEIEMAQEDGLDTSLLLAKRKRIRGYLSMDLSSFNSIDELMASVPDELKKYWV